MNIMIANVSPLYKYSNLLSIVFFKIHPPLSSFFFIFSRLNPSYNVFSTLVSSSFCLVSIRSLSVNFNIKRQLFYRNKKHHLIVFELLHQLWNNPITKISNNFLLFYCKSHKQNIQIINLFLLPNRL